MARFGGSNEAFFIGGERIFKEAMDYAERIYLTTVDYEEIDGDNKRYFPVIPDSFKVNDMTVGDSFAFLEYVR